jgi:hypothetical protein
VVEKIRNAVHILQNFSNNGRVVLDFSDGTFRELLAYSYRIIDRFPRNGPCHHEEQAG